MNQTEINILLAEYSEAGQQCRWYEQLTRMALTIYAGFVVATVSYQGSAWGMAMSNMIVSFYGIVISIVFLCTHYRNNMYYRGYMLRLHYIEKKLNMRLYLDGLDVYKSSKLPPNKFIFSLIYITGCAIFCLPFVINMSVIF